MEQYYGTNDVTFFLPPGKTVLMYCTGGIRCERASALLRKRLGDDVGDIFQLQGGIEKYLLSYPEGGHWKGQNYAFDKVSSGN